MEHIRAEPGRYATWAPPAAYFEKGYLWMKSPADWPALAPTRGTLFEIPDALGYNPVQLPRYWRYIRATNDLSVFYNASVLNMPSVEDVRLLGLRYLVIPTGLESPVDGRIVEEADGYSLWELEDRQPEATGTDQVERARNVQEALEVVTSPGFDPADTAVVEDPDIFGAVGEATVWDAEIVQRTHTLLRLSLEPSNGGVLTLRNAFDPGWRAEIDGRDARTIPVDGFLQGVIVTDPRSREVVLTYHDDAVMLGLALGALIWASLLAAPLLALARERRDRSHDAGYAVSPRAARRRSSPSMNRSMSPPRTREGSPTSTSVRWSFTIWYGAST